MPPLTDAIVVAVQSKKWWASRTFWLNAITGILTIASMPEMMKVLPPAAVAVIAGTVIPVLNVIVRLWTFAPVTGTPGATAAQVAQPDALLASVTASTPTLAVTGAGTTKVGTP